MGSGAIALLFAIFAVFISTPLQAEPNTGSGKSRSPKCETEYQACAKKCDQTQIDIDSQVQQWKSRCASNTDM